MELNWPGPAAGLFAFGPFTLDTGTRSVLAHDQPVSLQPRTFELLEFLVRNPGRPVAKSEILDAVWPSEDVTEGNLTQQMFLLRATLARHSARLTYIVTEPGRGYRFVARVSTRESLDAHDHPAASRLYARGRFFYEKRTADSLHRSIHYFRQAIELDPAFGRAHAGLASAYALSGEYLLLGPAIAFPRAAEAARRALQIDPSLADPHTVLGEVACHYERDYRRAEQHYARAAALAPNASRTVVFRAWFACIVGRADDAAAMLRAALDDEPYSLIMQTTLAVTAIFRRAYDEAIDHLRAVLDMDADYVHARFYLAIATYLQGRFAEVLMLTAGPVPDGYEQQFMALRGSSLGRLGRTEAARAIGEDMRGLTSRGRFVSVFNLAWLAIGVGELDHAVRLLETGFAERDPWLVFLPEHPLFDELRGDEQFDKLVRRLRPPPN